MQTDVRVELSGICSSKNVLAVVPTHSLPLFGRCILIRATVQKLRFTYAYTRKRESIGTCINVRKYDMVITFSDTKRRVSIRVCTIVVLV